MPSLIKAAFEIDIRWQVQNGRGSRIKLKCSISKEKQFTDADKYGGIPGNDVLKNKINLAFIAVAQSYKMFFGEKYDL